MRLRYVVQANCTGMGWVDTRHEGATLPEAKQAEAALLANDAAWMPGPRETRIHDRAGRVRWLSCCVCGAGTRGRQWWNRDTGFGICETCADEQAARETPERHKDLYGQRGVHFGITQEAA